MSSGDDNDPVHVYLREVANVRALTSQEEADLWRHVWANDDKSEVAKKRLIEANLSLVASLAQRYSSSGIALLDLIQQGNKSLMAALESFPHNWSGAFSDYAAPRVERAISQFVHQARSRNR